MNKNNVPTYIYAICDPRVRRGLPTVVWYVGQSYHLHRRMYEHFGGRTNSHLSRRINKYLTPYGIVPKVLLLDACGSDKEADASEIAWMEFYRDNGHDLCNVTSGGEGIRGYKFSAKSIKKMSDSGKNRSSESFPRGAKRSDDAKLLMSKKKLGVKRKPFTDVTRKKMSDARLGMSFSADHISNLGRARHNTSHVKKHIINYKCEFCIPIIIATNRCRSAHVNKDILDLTCDICIAFMDTQEERILGTSVT